MTKPKQTEAEQIAAVDALLTLGRNFLVDVAVLAIVKSKQVHDGDLANLEARQKELEKKLSKRQLELVQAIAAAVRDR
jgi:hypothetical protein